MAGNFGGKRRIIFGSFTDREKAQKRADEKGARVERVKVKGRTRYVVVRRA